MSSWVTLASAKIHLGETTSDRDAAIQQALDAAEAFVLAYIGIPGPDPSPLIPRAICEQTAEFLRFRGDDTAGNAATLPELAGEPSPFIKRLLYRFRDPSAA